MPRQKAREPASATSPEGTSKKLVWAGAAVVTGLAAFLILRSPSDDAKSAADGAAASARPQTKQAPSELPATKPTSAPGPTSRPTARASGSGVPVEQLGPTPSEPPSESDAALRDLVEAKDDDSPAGTDKLIASLRSKDDVVVAEAANELVTRRATRAIGELASIDLRDAAGSGLSIIDALGSLGAVAKGDEKNEAVERLLALLESEKQRRAPESAANLLQLYEALGKTGDARAASALEAELLDPSVGRAPKVVIVQSLVLLAQPTSHDVLVAAHKQQTDLPVADEFDGELKVELLGVIEAALQKL